MKKIVMIPLLMILLLTSALPAKAEISLIQLTVSASNVVAGEKAEYAFHLAPLDGPMEANQWITILTPAGLQIPDEITLTDIWINDSCHPLACEVVPNQSILLQIPPIPEDYLSIGFQSSGQFGNPTSLQAIDFTLVWEDRSIMVFSNKLYLKAPANSVEYEFSESQTVPYWYNQPVYLTLTSSVAKEIRYTLNRKKEELYQSPLLLQQGRYEIAITGIRSSGIREETIELAIQIDTQKPIVTVISPEENLITNQSSTPFVFRIQDLSKVQLTLQNKDYYIESDGLPVEISIPVTLQDGVNHISWKAMDEVGFQTSGSIVVNLDRTPPAFTVFSPRKGDMICGNQVEITGKSEPGSRLLMGEKAIPLDVFGNFSLFLVPAKGKNILLFRCFDPAGNETRVEIEYFYYAGIMVEVWINQDKAKVEGKEISVSPPPMIEPDSGEIYLPLRFIPSVIDYRLEWNASDSVAILKRNEIQILIKPNDSKIRIKTGGKSESIELNHPPLLINKVIMVPAEFLKKILGAELLFNEEENRLSINFCDRSES